VAAGAGKPQRPGDAEALARLGRLRELAAEVRRQRAAAEVVEDEAVVAFQTGGDEPPPGLNAKLANVTTDWNALLFKLYAVYRTGADRVTLVLFSEYRAHPAELVDAIGPRRGRTGCGPTAGCTPRSPRRRRTGRRRRRSRRSSRSRRKPSR
jgi:hypothetical protein